MWLARWKSVVSTCARPPRSPLAAVCRLDVRFAFHIFAAFALEASPSRRRSPGSQALPTSFGLVPSPRATDMLCAADIAHGVGYKGHVHSLSFQFAQRLNRFRVRLVYGLLQFVGVRRISLSSSGRVPPAFHSSPSRAALGRDVANARRRR